MIENIRILLVFFQFLFVELQIISYFLLKKYKQGKIKLTKQNVEVFRFLSWFLMIPIIEIMIIVLIL